MIAGRTVVTGGQGYIGRHVVRRLLSGGATVAVVSRARNDAPPPEHGVSLLSADVRDAAALRQALQPDDTVIHLACLAVGPSRTDPVSDFAVNAAGTFNVLNAARDHGARRVVVVSSAEVYGPPIVSPIAEDHPLLPNSPYGASKASGDLYARVYRSLYGVDAVVLRLFNVFGPAADGSPRRTVETIFATNARAGLPLVMQAHPETSRDFVYVNDAVDAIVACASGSGSQPVYNIGSGTATTLAQLALAAGYPASAIPASAESFPGLPIRADVTQATRDLLFAPSKSVLDYVRELRDAPLAQAAVS